MKIKIKEITIISVFLALTIAISFLKIIDLGNGSFVSLSTMPILLVSLLYGSKIGIQVGIYSSIILVFLESSVLHPFSIIFDYLLSYSVLGLVGLSKNSKTLNMLLNIIFVFFLRFLFHFLSGVIVFGKFSKGTNPWIYSSVFNGIYIMFNFLLNVPITIFLLKLFKNK